MCVSPDPVVGVLRHVFTEEDLGFCESPGEVVRTVVSVLVLGMSLLTDAVESIGGAFISENLD